MKKIFVIISVLFITACGAIHQVVTDKKTDEISTILIENNHLYVLGKIHDYEFTDPELVNDLPKLLQSKYAHLLSNINISFKILKNGDVSGGYTLFIKPTKLSENDMQILINNLGFENKVYKYNTPPYQPYSMLVKTYGYKYELVRDKYLDYEKNDKPNGRIVKLENKGAIIQKYQLNPKPKVTLLYSETETDIGLIALSSAAVALSAPFVVSLPISAPLMIGCMISDGPCN